jgi:hypothetical protein
MYVRQDLPVPLAIWFAGFYDSAEVWDYVINAYRIRGEGQA